MSNKLELRIYIIGVKIKISSILFLNIRNKFIKYKWKDM